LSPDPTSAEAATIAARLAGHEVEAAIPLGGAGNSRVVCHRAAAEHYGPAA
jgi:hypothetical protein